MLLGGHGILVFFRERYGERDRGEKRGGGRERVRVEREGQRESGKGMERSCFNLTNIFVETLPAGFDVYFHFQLTSCENY